MTPDARTLLQASALPERWHGQRQHTLLLADFGQGQAFLGLWRAWREDGQRPDRLLVFSHSLHLPQTVEVPPELAELVAIWPPATPNFHLLDLEGGCVRLLLAVGPSQALRQVRQLQAETLWVDGSDLRQPRALSRLAAPGATLLVWNASLGQRDTLRAGGFVREVSSDGQADVERWNYAPRTGVRAAATPPETPETPETREARQAREASRQAAPGAALHAKLHARLQATPQATLQAKPQATPHATPHATQHATQHATRHATRHAVIIGAGIAGACAAAALAQRGWACTVLDARALPARGASGNPAALVHGTVHAADGTHARFTRAAALHAQRVYAGLLTRGVPGSLQGLLRSQAEAPTERPPTDWAQAWTASQLQARGSGLLADSAWFFPGAGWLDAAAAVQALLATPGVTFSGQAVAAQLQRADGDWCVLDAQGQALARAPVLVLTLAAAGDLVAPSLGALLQSAGALSPPLTRTRGQVSWFDHASPALPWPVAGGGYALRCDLAGQTSVLCGATTQEDDDDAEIRAADHVHNLARLQTLTGITPLPDARLHGRVGWRERTPDRLPLVGPLPAADMLSALPPASDQRLARLPRVPGLFMLGGMAGRGFTWGPLAGEVLASLIDGSLLPLEGELLDALDPARFWLRQSRRATG